MATATKRLNFMIRAELAEEFEAIVPAGMRSKVVNEALSKELVRMRRQKATEKLMKLREKCPVVTTDEILRVLRADRARDSE